jgi:hypothetical protein
MKSTIFLTTRHHSLVQVLYGSQSQDYAQLKGEYLQWLCDSGIKSIAVPDQVNEEAPLEASKFPNSEYISMLRAEGKTTYPVLIGWNIEFANENDAILFKLRWL